MPVIFKAWQRVEKKRVFGATPALTIHYMGAVLEMAYCERDMKATASYMHTFFTTWENIKSDLEYAARRIRETESQPDGRGARERLSTIRENEDIPLAYQ